MHNMNHVPHNRQNQFTFNNQMQSQHKAVARGPKLNFPESNGNEPDGWIRKAEKYFELVGVPTEDRVKIAVLLLKLTLGGKDVPAMQIHYHGIIFAE